MTTKCEACWVEFPDQRGLDLHVQMEESVDWPIDGLTIVEGERPGCANPSGRSRQWNHGGGCG